MATTELDIQQDILVPLPLETIWDCLINKDGLKTWFGADHFDIDPYQGGRILIPFAKGDESIQIIGDTGLLITNKKYVCSWIERDSKGKEWFYPTLVAFELSEADGGTLLSITHSGFHRLPSGIRDGVVERYSAYWRDERRLEALHSLLIAASTEQGS